MIIKPGLQLAPLLGVLCRQLALSDANKSVANSPELKIETVAGRKLAIVAVKRKNATFAIEAEERALDVSAAALRRSENIIGRS